MIQDLFGEFLSRYCGSVHPDDVQRLSTRLAGYLSRVVRSKKLMEHAKAIDVADDFRSFRRRLDGNPYTSSRMWRAVWQVVSGRMRPRKACKVYRVLESDLEWVMANLSVKQIQAIEKQAAGEWIQMPDYAGIEREIRSTAPYCRGYVKRLEFITNYDHGLEARDFEQDMLCAGLAAAYRSDHRTDNLVWLRNIAWRSAKNFAQSKIKYHTTKGRQRIERIEERTLEKTSVKVYRRATCWRCKKSSETAICAPCAVIINKSKTEKERWTNAAESPATFMKKRAVFAVEETISAQTHHTFQSTVSSLHAPVGRSDEPAVLMDVLADEGQSTDSTSTRELIHDLGRQPLAIQKVCAVILGTKDRDFDAWLRGRHGPSTDRLHEKKITNEACEFYGVTKKKLRSVMAPLLLDAAA